MSSSQLVSGCKPCVNCGVTTRHQGWENSDKCRAGCQPKPPQTQGGQYLCAYPGCNNVAYWKQGSNPSPGCSNTHAQSCFQMGITKPRS
jgi:hypothetical protein